MTRILALLMIAGLVLVPSAAAKGPHAVLSSKSEPVEAGRPWDVTLELMETRGRARPTLLARREDRIVAVRGRLVRSDGFVSRYKLQVVFPRDGRWRLTLVDRKRRFAFPAVAVGSDRVPQDYVAFPKGSMAERQGGGGPYDAPENSVGHGEPLPPETVAIADTDTAADSGDGGGIPLWILPVVGLVLAGAGAGVWRLRGR
jgi:hypothetical protein